MSSLQKQKFWNRTARSSNTSKLNIPHPVINHLEPYLRKGDAVLDLGCGSGKISVDMAIKTREVIGVDFAPNNIRLASQTAQNRGVSNVTFIEKSIESLDFPHSQFDVITAFSVLPYIEDLPAFYRSVGELLRPNGWFIITTPSLKKSFSPLRWLLGTLSRWSILPPMTFFTREMVVNGIEEAGFAIEEVSEISKIPEMFVASQKQQGVYFERD